jgi:hypothetical protein
MSRADAGSPIGPVGAGTRLLAALVLLSFALVGGDISWSLGVRDVVLGLVVFPAVTIAVGFAARRFRAGPLHYTGWIAIGVNCALIVLLLANPYTGGGAELFYGTTLLVAAWRRRPDCETTALANWVLDRNDQIGCPVFTPLDRAEARVLGLSRPGDVRADEV